MASDEGAVRSDYLEIDDEGNHSAPSRDIDGTIEDEFSNGSSIDVLIKGVSGLVVFLSVSIILLWATYQSADITFGGPPQSLQLWED